MDRWIGSLNSLNKVNKYKMHVPMLLIFPLISLAIKDIPHTGKYLGRENKKSFHV